MKCLLIVTILSLFSAISCAHWGAYEAEVRRLEQQNAVLMARLNGRECVIPSELIDDLEACLHYNEFMYKQEDCCNCIDEDLEETNE